MGSDMPIEELYRYNGCSPRPDDFDEYWARALVELDTVDPSPEFRPSSFQVPGSECFDLWFNGVGGSRIYAKYARPKSGGKHPAVLSFHGYSANSGDWLDKIGYSGAGFCMFAMDVRGQGGRSEDMGGAKGPTLNCHVLKGIEDHPDRLFYRSVYLDTVQLARVAASLPEVDPDRMGAVGGSQGGGLSIACAALYPNIRRIAVQYPFLSDFKRSYEAFGTTAAWEQREYFRRHDPQGLTAESVFYKLGYIDIQNLAPRVKAKVLMMTALQDTTVPPSTQFAAYNKFPGEKKVLFFPDYGHEYIPDVSDISITFLAQL